MTDKAVQITETNSFGGKNRGGHGKNYYQPYTEDDKRDFKILWPSREKWKESELPVMKRLFRIEELIIVDEQGKELRRVP